MIDIGQMGDLIAAFNARMASLMYSGCSLDGAAEALRDTVRPFPSPLVLEFCRMFKAGIPSMVAAINPDVAWQTVTAERLIGLLDSIIAEHTATITAEPPATIQ